LSATNAGIANQSNPESLAVAVAGMIQRLCRVERSFCSGGDGERERLSRRKKRFLKETLVVVCCSYSFVVSPFQATPLGKAVSLLTK
jgi:hypothetical protein